MEVWRGSLFLHQPGRSVVKKHKIVFVDKSLAHPSPTKYRRDDIDFEAWLKQRRNSKSYSRDEIM